MDIPPPVYHSDEAPDYRRVVITYSEQQQRKDFWDDIASKLAPFRGELYAEFFVKNLQVKIWNLKNKERSVTEAIARLQTEIKDEGFKAERDMRLGVLQLTTDPYSGRQWALDRMEVCPAWRRVAEAGAGRPPVIVAVIDSGAQPGHEDFDTPPRLDGIRLVPKVDNKFADDTGHGTMLAGTIAAVSGNKYGIAGVASNPFIAAAGRLPDLRLYAVKFDDARNPPTASLAVLGMAHALVAGAQIINASWHVLDGRSVLRAMIAVLGALDPPVLVVAAAGNNGRNNNKRPPTLPASYPLDNILSVMASNEYDDKAWFSNYGTNVDIAAPGTGILSTSMYYVKPPAPPHRGYNPAYRTYTGTSAAAAHASGAAALLLAIDNWTPSDIRRHLNASADPVRHLTGLCRANGRLNVRRAVCGPFVIDSPTGTSFPKGSSLTVQWRLEYNTPVVDKVEISVRRRVNGSLVGSPLGTDIPATTGTLTANLPNLRRRDVVVRVRSLDKNLYTDSNRFDIV